MRRASSSRKSRPSGSSTRASMEAARESGDVVRSSMSVYEREDGGRSGISSLLDESQVTLIWYAPSNGASLWRPQNSFCLRDVRGLACRADHVHSVRPRLLA